VSQAEAVKRALIGRPRASGEMHETLLSKKLALPIFASDPLSSVAYATEAALVVLVAASATAASLVLPISVAIAIVLAIVVLSYRQTVRAYQTSGGAYVVAKENLGKLPSLVAAAALLVDYVLTVAVSVAAGVLALTSAAPALESHAVALSLGFVALITLVNLRGVRESGVLFAIPTYAFVAAMFALVGTGVTRCVDGECPHAHVVDPVATGAGTVGVFVLLRAFASGAAALTGVEAISNGVSAFRPPEGRNAARTLLVMGAIASTLFVGVSYLAVVMDARPSESVSLVSEIARATFPASSVTSPMYFAVQALTFGILVLGRKHLIPGVPPPCRRPRPRPFLPAPVRQPWRPARLLERDRRARRDRGAADLALSRRCDRADPSLRRWRLHGLHALPGRDGSLLAASQGAGLAQEGRRERRWRVGYRTRDDPGHPSEVRRRRLDGRDRDPASDRAVPAR
jgi:hypothetical protein